MAERTTGAEPGRLSAPEHFWWLLVSLTALACMPHIMSAFFLPKILWLALSLALAFFLLRRDGSPVLALTPWGAVCGAYLLWALLSLGWSPARQAGFERWLVLLLLALAYLLARRVRFWEADAFWRLFCGLFALVSLLGCLQYLLGDHPAIDWLPKVAPPNGTLAGNRNLAAVYLLVTLPFIAWRCFKEERPRRVALPAVAMLLGVAFLLFTRSRGAWLGAAAGVIFLVLAGGLEKLLAERKKAALLLAAFLITALLGGLIRPAKSVPIGESKHSIGDLVRNAGSAITSPGDVNRWNHWVWALGLDTSPFRGCGYGGFPIVGTLQHREGGVLMLDWEFDNDFLKVYVELGAVGLGLYLLLLFYLLRLAWKGRSDGRHLAAGAAIAGFGVAQFFTHVHLAIGANLWLAGVAALLNSQSADEPLFSRPAPAGLQRRLLDATALALLVLVVVAGLTIRGDRRLRREIKAARPDYQRLIKHVLPEMVFDATTVHAIANIYAERALADGEYEAAEVFARKALSLHPADYVCRGVLGEVALQDGRWLEAIDSFTRALGYAIDPRHRQEFTVKLARCLARTEQYDRAIRRLENLLRPARDFDNPYSPALVELVEVYRQAGQDEKAEALWAGALKNKVGIPSNPSPGQHARIEIPNGKKKTEVEIRFDWDDCNGARYYEFRVRERSLLDHGLPVKLIKELRLTQSETRLLLKLKPADISRYFWTVRAVGKYSEESSTWWWFRAKK